MKEAKKIDVNKTKNEVIIKINPKIYPLPIVYQTSDVFIDKSYVFLDGDPEEEIEVMIKPKEKGVDLKKIAGDFNNELLNYSAYFIRSQMNKDFRHIILEKALSTVERGGSKIKEKTQEKQKIDIGLKVPLYKAEESSENRADNEEFDEDEIRKVWEEQKGAIKDKSKRTKTKANKEDSNEKKD